MVRLTILFCALFLVMACGGDASSATVTVGSVVVPPAPAASTLPLPAEVPSGIDPLAVAQPRRPDVVKPVGVVPMAASPVPTAAVVVKRTRLPSTAHVKFEVTPAMQALLDADSRMEPWLNQVLPIIDACYRDVLRINASAAGAVTVALTMHENARPTASPKSVPAALTSVVPCATGRLFSMRPPLFTGPEGQKHTVSVKFTP